MKIFGEESNKAWQARALYKFKKVYHVTLFLRWKQSDKTTISSYIYIFYSFIIISLIIFYNFSLHKIYTSFPE